MSSNENDQQRSKGDFREQAKSEVREAIRKAEQSPVPQQAKKELAKQLLEQVSEVIEEARGVVEDEERVKIKGGSPITGKEKENVAARFIKLTEAVKQGIVVAKKPEAQAFLQKVVEEIPNPSTSQANHLVAYLSPYLLGEKDIIINSPDQPKSEFQKDFEILASVNPKLAERVKEALRKGGEEGKITSITRDTIERLKIKGENESSVDENQSYMTEEERLDYIRLWRKIWEQYQSRTRTDKENRQILEIQISFRPSEERSFLLSLGLLSEQEVDQFIRLRKKFNTQLNTKFLGQYTPMLERFVLEAQQDFSNIDRFFTIQNGKVTITKENMQKFEDLIRRYYYEGLKYIHEDTSRDFHSILREKSELGHYFSLISQVITYACDRIKQRFPDTPENREIRLFFEDKGGPFMSRIMNNAQLFHNLPLYARNLGSIEEIKKLFSYIYPSQLAEVFDDKSNLMAIARDELTMLLREYLVKNNNQYRGDLLSGKYNEEGARWNEWFKLQYKERLKDKLRRLKLYREDVDEWKLDMLRTYAEGIGIATLIDGEILATSDPVSHFREVHPSMSLLSAKHNWKGGRGLDVPGLINRFLLGMDVDLIPQERPVLARLVSKRKFVPQAFYNLVEKKLKDYGGLIADEMTDGRSKASLFGMGGLYQELISMFNLPGDILSWGGWRVQGITEELGRIYELIYGIESPSSDKRKDWTQEEWQNFFDLSLELYGNTSLWWQIGVFGQARPTKEVQRLLKEKFSEVEAAQLEKERPNNKVIEIDGRKMSFFELRMWRMNQLRGELFFRYLRRNPGDFLQIMAQLCPEVLDKTGAFFTSDSEQNKKKRNIYLKRWGSNFIVFERVNQWLRNNMGKFNDPMTGKPFDDPKEFMVYFRERTSDAFERMKVRNEEARREIIRIINDNTLNEQEKKAKIIQTRKNILYLSKEDFNGDDQLWKIFAEEQNSFFQVITGLSYDKADDYFANFGTYNKLGQQTIFFQMANNWVLRNGDINPFAADVSYYDIFKHISYAGESTISRLQDANISNYKEVLSQIPNLENILIEAANSKKFDEIYKLHKKIFDTLSGLVGPEYAYRANYILAQIVTNFFIEHSILRDPKWQWLGPIGWLAKSIFGRNISLSKILTKNLHAYSMDNNAVRSYFEALVRQFNVLPEHGIFSKDQLERVFEVTDKEFILGDVAPRLLWYIALFLLLMAIRKAISEELEEKKK